jgi:CRP-like cAMP-binding protein
MPELFSLRSYKAGEAIYHEGDPAPQFFIVRQGSVRVHSRVHIMPDAELHAGDFFGTASALSGHPYTDSADVISAGAVIGSKSTQFGQLSTLSPGVAKKILLDFSEGIRVMNDALSNRYELSTPRLPQKKTDPPLESDNIRIYPAGSIIFNEGDTGDALFIIQSGQVRIAKKSAEDEMTLAYLKSGDIFGEMGLLENQPRSASAFAHTDCSLMRVEGDNFDQVMSQPAIVQRLAVMLAGRAWFLTRQLANSKIKDPKMRLIDIMVTCMEKENVIPSLQSYTMKDTADELFELAGMDTKAGTESLHALNAERKLSWDGENVKVVSGVDLFRADEVFWKFYRDE